MTQGQPDTSDKNDESQTVAMEIPNWQDRAKIAEEELSTERTRFAQQARRNRRLQGQIQEFTEALGQSVHDCSVLRYHFQLVSNSNMALSEELQKAKYMIQTLEAVIQMLFMSSKAIDSAGSIGGAQSTETAELSSSATMLGSTEVLSSVDSPTCTETLDCMDSENCAEHATR